MITASTTPLHPDDRFAMWAHKRSAYTNNQAAANHFANAPFANLPTAKYRFNLATNTRDYDLRLGKQVRSAGPTDARQRGTNESQSGGRFLFFCNIALAACGLVAWLALAWVLPALLDLVVNP